MKITMPRLYGLCQQYGYRYDAIMVQNLFKRWTEEQIIDDLGNELLKQFYPNELPYKDYLQEVNKNV